MDHVEVSSRLEDEHLDQLPELIRAACRADGHDPIGEHKFLRLRHGDDLAVALVAYGGGRLAGYAHTLAYPEADGGRRVSCEFVVHPEARGAGIGRMLLGRSVEHAEATGGRRIDVWAYNDAGAGGRLAAEFGFAPTRRLLHLHRHMRDLPDAPAPQGATLRAFSPGEDDERWLALNNRIFAGHPENGSWTLDDLGARMEQPWFSGDDFLLIEADGDISGFCWLKVEERPDEGLVGEIYVIGTAPEQRGRGLARFLVVRALRRMHDRDVNTAAVYVDESNAPAVALYRSLGFHYHHVDVCYSRDLASARPARGESARVAA